MILEGTMLQDFLEQLYDKLTPADINCIFNYKSTNILSVFPNFNDYFVTYGNFPSCGPTHYHIRSIYLQGSAIMLETDFTTKYIIDLSYFKSFVREKRIDLVI
jgi:hypothetical protein